MAFNLPIQDHLTQHCQRYSINGLARLQILSANGWPHVSTSPLHRPGVLVLCSCGPPLLPPTLSCLSGLFQWLSALPFAQLATLTRLISLLFLLRSSSSSSLLDSSFAPLTVPSSPVEILDCFANRKQRRRPRRRQRSQRVRGTTRITKRYNNQRG